MKILLLQDDIYLPSYAGGLKATRKLMETLAGTGHQSAVVSPALTRSRDGPNTLNAFQQEMSSCGIRVQTSFLPPTSHRIPGGFISLTREENMNRISTSTAVAGLLAGVLTPGLSAQSGWKDLTGKPVPAVTAAAWLNTNGQKPTSTTMKGKVWLIEFFATW